LNKYILLDEISTRKPMKIIFLCGALNSQIGGHEYFGVLERVIKSVHKYSPTFRRSYLSPSSGIVITPDLEAVIFSDMSPMTTCLLIRLQNPVELNL
jgi:hypothetical protein